VKGKERKEKKKNLGLMVWPCRNISSCVGTLAYFEQLPIKCDTNQQTSYAQPMLRKHKVEEEEVPCKRTGVSL